MDLDLGFIDREAVIMMAAVFVIGAIAGYVAGSPQVEPGDSEVMDVDYEANSSNPVEEASFFNQSVNLVAQSQGNTTEFFVEVNGSFEPLDKAVRDGEIHEVRKFVTLNGEMFLLSLRYSDDREAPEDGWLQLHQVRKL